ncbi:helix-turn-helix transcriptional regulator [Kineosporia babensis]|uniref:Helix-turn-helix transcriptional regulator n=1 Tax=Kineosporia babensis TaxID=499548 RepID=A0A9X1SW65_9ACTN|nr:helix-turn-helix transcriptional regulator [Kineosporia babensis]MCD5314409.1 helix-turn-helix transcriptional regulator [Kineosporia babensis]
MDAPAELTHFLTTRRGRIQPAQAGVTQVRGRRRVPGLRREEVAYLAGVSVEYYTRLEQGRAKGASEEVLISIAKALQLNETERAHLFDLARAVGPARKPSRPRTAVPSTRPELQTLLHTVTDAAVLMISEKGDVLGANALGRALYSPMFTDAAVSMPRFIFLDPSARMFHRDWESVAETVVGLLRRAAGRNPYDKSLTDLVGELSLRSDVFRVRWAAHEVQPLTSGRKSFRHPEVGDLDLEYEYLSIVSNDEVFWLMYFAEPGTPAHDSLQLLGTLAAAERTGHLS